MRCFRRWVALALAMLLMVAPTRAQEACAPGTALFGGINEKGWVDSQGKRHIGFSIPTDIPVAMQNAMQAAMTEWNGKSGTTGVIFEPGGNDLSFIDNTPFLDANDLPCAVYNADGDEVQFEYWIALEFSRISDIDDENDRNAQMAAFSSSIQTVFAHEVGHFLGLKQQSPGIMSGVTGGNSCASALPTLPSDGRVVTDTDAQNAADCSTRYIQPEQGFDGEGYYDEGPVDGEDVENCVGTFRVNTTYRYDFAAKRWYVFSESYTLLYFTCYPA
jgi:hypothetical protein